MTPAALDAVAWSRIDTVLLDLDGTLLDLGYDNHFWNVMVPEVWARARGLDLASAQQQLRPHLPGARRARSTGTASITGVVNSGSTSRR